MLWKPRVVLSASDVGSIHNLQTKLCSLVFFFSFLFHFLTIPQLFLALA